MKTYIMVMVAAGWAVTAAASTEDYDGLYVPDAEGISGWDCKTIGMDGGALSIEDNVFTGVENQCVLSNPEPVRDLPATIYDGVCSAEGTEERMSIMLMRTLTGIAVIRGDGVITPLRRCE